jgi:carbonic anhydrase
MASSKSKNEAKVHAATEIKSQVKAKSQVTTNFQTKTETKLKTELKVEAKFQTKSESQVKANSKEKLLTKNSVKNLSKIKAELTGKTSASMSAKDKRSMMEYLNSLYFTNEDKKYSRVPNNNNVDSLSQPKYIQTTIDNTNITSATTIPDVNKFIKKLPSKIVLPKKDDMRLLLEDWLRISSPMFKNRARFPSISMPNGTMIEINVDHNFFRINSAFDDNNPDPTMPPGILYFWFRLSGRNIYYSSTTSDVNILGAIRIINIIDTNPHNDYSTEATCFTIKDNELKNWKLCADSIDIRNKWVCKIKEILMINDDLCLHKEGNQPTVIERIVKEPIILIPLPSRMCNEGWDYMRHGVNWECECSEGKEQSPINLPPREKAIDSPIRPLFQYENAEAKATYTTLDDHMREGEYIKIRNVDGALRIFHKYFGKVVTLDGAVFNAEEVVFHTPAEHTIDGKKYDMEMQIIHYGQTKGDISKQVVLSFLFERKPGVYNKFLDDVDFFNLPNPVTKERSIKNNLFIPKVFYTADDDDMPIMRPFDFYTYQGSISFPPCTERTIVYVAAKPLQIGSAALQLFQEALRIPDMVTQTGDVVVSDNINGNNRQIQPVNGRPIFYYKACDLFRKKVIQPTGHYEKVIKEATKYFYVNGEQPSGLPGAFVVSKKEALGQTLA